MKIIPLSEGSFTVDKTKHFVPFDLSKDILNDRPRGSLLIEVQPFAVISSKDIIVIDTGLGFSTGNGVLQIHQNLIDNNINPSDVTKVLLSHLHKDHAGGMSTFDKILNKRFESFPNAVYYINKQEFGFAMQQGSPSFKTEDFEIFKNSDKVYFTEGSGTIDGYIHYELTGAHSPFHQVFRIEENNEIIFFGGDVAPQLSQMRSKFIAKYDYDGKRCMELRQEWRELGEKEGWRFLFYHDIKIPVFQF